MRATPWMKLVLVTGLVGLTGCARRTTTQGPMAQTTAETPSPPASQIIFPRDNVWKYGFMPVPAPSRTPLYRVNDITFTEGTTTYGPEGNGVCRDTASQLASSGVSRILLVGHCHKDEAANGGLSLQRAKKVKDCLVGHGLSADMFEVSSYGSAFSKADRTEPMKMEQERRVEIWVVSE